MLVALQISFHLDVFDHLFKGSVPDVTQYVLRLLALRALFSPQLTETGLAVDFVALLAHLYFLLNQFVADLAAASHIVIVHGIGHR